MVGQLGHGQREQLDRLLSVLMLINMADRQIAVELARLGELATRASDEYSVGNQAGDCAAKVIEQVDVSTLRKLHAYRRRFRAQRDMCLKRIIRPNPRRG